MVLPQEHLLQESSIIVINILKIILYLKQICDQDIVIIQLILNIKDLMMSVVVVIFREELQAQEILKQKGIVVGAHILSIGNVKDERFPYNVDETLLSSLSQKQYPTIKEDVFEKMEATILKARENLDSVGGKVECVALHVPAGIGEPFFDSLESHLSSLMFSIPAVKSVSFGDGEMIDQMLDSEANDCYYYDENGDVKTSSNHNGGITGGITNGMPVSCTVTFKPTPSIAKKQKTINVETKENVELEIKGRHDPCIVQRAVVVVEAMMALGILDMMGE